MVPVSETPGSRGWGNQLLLLLLPPSLPQGHPTQQVHSCLVMTQGAKMLDCSTRTLLGFD